MFSCATRACLPSLLKLARLALQVFGRNTGRQDALLKHFNWGRAGGKESGDRKAAARSSLVAQVNDWFMKSRAFDHFDKLFEQNVTALSAGAPSVLIARTSNEPAGAQVRDCWRAVSEAARTGFNIAHARASVAAVAKGLELAGDRDASSRDEHRQAVVPLRLDEAAIPCAAAASVRLQSALSAICQRGGTVGFASA